MIFLCLKVLKKPWGCLNCTWCLTKALRIFWGCLNCTWGCLKVLKKTLGLFELCQARCFGPLKKVILPRMARSLIMIYMWHVYVYLGIGQITDHINFIYPVHRAEVRSTNSYQVLTKGAPLNQHPSKISLFSWMIKIGANWWSFGKHHPEIRWVFHEQRLIQQQWIEYVEFNL